MYNLGTIKEDLPFINSDFPVEPSIESRHTYQYKTIYEKIELAILHYRNLHMKMLYSGCVITHQIYVDEEVLPGGMCHVEESCFWFDAGKLNAGRSIIHRMADTFISKFV